MPAAKVVRGELLLLLSYCHCPQTAQKEEENGHSMACSGRGEDSEMSCPSLLATA